MKRVVNTSKKKKKFITKKSNAAQKLTNNTIKIEPKLEKETIVEDKENQSDLEVSSLASDSSRTGFMAGSVVKSKLVSQSNWNAESISFNIKY